MKGSGKGPAPARACCATFETAFGLAGVAWTAGGLTRVLLPEATAAALRTKLESFGEAASAPPSVHDAIRRLQATLDGGSPSLSEIRLELTQASPFFRRVYEIARRIPRGELRSYAALAGLAGSPAASRAVGQAMARNPWPVIVPCHRVVAAGGKPGGFSAPGGLATKARLLALENRALDPS